jgi:hypothetical protein
MAILARRNKEKPAWLDHTRDFCHHVGIKIMAWGPNMLTVEAKSADRAAEIAKQLGQLGFKVVKYEDDEYAGLLSLSQDPDALQADIRQKNASFDISRRHWQEQVEPLIWAVIALVLLLPGIPARNNAMPKWLLHLLGFLSLAAFFWDSARIWGWRLEVGPADLRIRRYFRWTAIPWNEIRGVESISAGRSQEALVLKLASRRPQRLGNFDVVYSRNVRDRLRRELAERIDAFSH